MQVVCIGLICGMAYLGKLAFDEWKKMQKEERVRQARLEWERVKKQRLMRTWQGDRSFWE